MSLCACKILRRKKKLCNYLLMTESHKKRLKIKKLQQTHFTQLNLTQKFYTLNIFHIYFIKYFILSILLLHSFCGQRFTFKKKFIFLINFNVFVFRLSSPQFLFYQFANRVTCNDRQKSFFFFLKL